MGDWKDSHSFVATVSQIVLQPNRFDFKRVLVRDMEEAKAALQQRISATQAQVMDST